MAYSRSPKAVLRRMELTSAELSPEIPKICPPLTRELGNAPAKGEALPSYPMIFLKSGGSVVANGGDVRLPSWSKDVHHEVP